MIDFNIGNFTISKKTKPFIIAEMSGNHKGEKELLLKLAQESIAAGAHAIKLQTYTADSMTIDHKENEFFIEDKSSIWKGNSLYDLYKEGSTPWEWHKDIFELCNKSNVPCFSSPFDEEAVDFLESLNAPAYKIASFENIDLPLIKKVAQTGKPTIISTGMATVSEIQDALEAFYSAGGKEIALLKCTSSYPSSPTYSNVLTIPHMEQLFDVHVGLSDHTLGIGVPIAACTLGARIIEKHITLDRNNGAIDSQFSLEPDELKQLVDESERAWQSLGKISYGPTDLDKKSLRYRRTIYITQDIQKDEILTEKNIRRIRPGLGLSPKYFDILIGKKVNQNLKRGTPLSWEHIS